MRYLIIFAAFISSIGCSKKNNDQQAAASNPLIGSYSGSTHRVSLEINAQNPVWQVFVDTTYYFRDTIFISKVHSNRVVLQYSGGYPDSLITLPLNSDTCIIGGKSLRFASGQNGTIYYYFHLCKKHDRLVGRIEVKPSPGTSQTFLTLNFQKIPL